MTDCRLDVLCIGNAIVDVIANATDDFLDAEGLVKGSMRLIDAEEAERLYSHPLRWGPRVRRLLLPLPRLKPPSQLCGRENFSLDLRRTARPFATDDQTGHPEQAEREPLRSLRPLIRFDSYMRTAFDDSPIFG